MMHQRPTQVRQKHAKFLHTQGLNTKFTWKPQTIHVLSNRFKSKAAGGTPCCTNLDRFICFTLRSFSDLKYATAVLEISSCFENWQSDLAKWGCKQTWSIFAASRLNLHPLSNIFINFLFTFVTIQIKILKFLLWF